MGFTMKCFLHFVEKWCISCKTACKKGGEKDNWRKKEGFALANRQEIRYNRN